MCYFRGIYFNTWFHFLAEHSVISHHHLHLHKTEFKTPIFYKTAPSWCRFYHHIRTPHEKRFLNYNVLSRWDKNLNNVVRSNKHNPIINALKYAPHKSASIQQALMEKQPCYYLFSIEISIMIYIQNPASTKSGINTFFLITSVEAKNELKYVFDLSLIHIFYSFLYASSWYK